MDDKMINITKNEKTLGYSIIMTKIQEVIEYCKEIFESFKSTVNKNRYAFLEVIAEELNTISKVLRQHNDIYQDELTCFVQIKSYILYIVGKNCEIEDFGHLNSVRFLLNLFKNLIDAKFRYIKCQIPQIEYEKKQKGYFTMLDEFDEYFNENILIENNKFDDDVEILNISMRE